MENETLTITCSYCNSQITGTAAEITRHREICEVLHRGVVKDNNAYSYIKDPSGKWTSEQIDDFTRG